MAETLTPNYGWTKPDPGASANVWGTELNSDLDKIDNQVFTNQQGLSPVGVISLWSGLVASIPANWMLCNGLSLLTASYPALFSIIGYNYGGSGANFLLPDMTNIFVRGTSNGTILNLHGGADTVTLSTAQMPVHNHVVTDTLHSHSVPQSVHNHGDPQHYHLITDVAHAHGASTGSHNHSINNPGHAHGGVAVGLGGGGSIADAFGWSLSIGNTSTVSTAISANAVGDIGVSVNSSGTGIGLTQYSPTGLTAVNANITNTAASGAGTATVNTGGGSSHTNVPSYIEMQYIIRVI